MCQCLAETKHWHLTRAIALEIGCGKMQIARIHDEKGQILNDLVSSRVIIKWRKMIYGELNAYCRNEWFCTASSKQILPIIPKYCLNDRA